ncbi:MAG TPA: response regulator [Terriglobales bacterium]|nr:response regulator [Terriglobales bacterium]
MKTKVLLIDDSKFLRKANEVALARSGFDVFGAADGEEGLRLACDKVPDVIVLDMMLPKISGPQLLQLLKQDPRTAGIPVIVLSSLSQKNEERLIHEGAAAYFEKSGLGLENGGSRLVDAIGSVLQTARAAHA